MVEKIEPPSDTACFYASRALRELEAVHRLLEEAWRRYSDDSINEALMAVEEAIGAGVRVRSYEALREAGRGHGARHGA